jgi:hypothetical protein
VLGIEGLGGALVLEPIEVLEGLLGGLLELPVVAGRTHPLEVPAKGGQLALVVCDGCECLDVPAALPVGAMDARGRPLESSNCGQTYQTQGVLALGEGILGAQPGGGTLTLSGTRFATPIVSGVAALPLGRQRQRGDPPDPHRVRVAILESALPCEAADDNRCLAGQLNIPGAYQHLFGETPMSEPVLGDFS